MNSDQANPTPRQGSEASLTVEVSSFDYDNHYKQATKHARKLLSELPQSPENTDLISALDLILSVQKD
jgi:hypothetical protein